MTELKYSTMSTILNLKEYADEHIKHEAEQIDRMKRNAVK
jgi:hypothetical protein